MGASQLSGWLLRFLSSRSAAAPERSEGPAEARDLTVGAVEMPHSAPLRSAAHDRLASILSSSRNLGCTHCHGGLLYSKQGPVKVQIVRGHGPRLCAGLWPTPSRRERCLQSRGNPCLTRGVAADFDGALKAG